MTKEHKHFDLVFITTSSNSKLLNEYIKKLYLNESVQLLVVLIAQNGIEVHPLNTPMISFQVIYERGSISLSKARNIGIKWLEKRNTKFTFVMFPDDDSTFDVSFFERFKNIVVKGNNYITDVKNQFEDKLFIKHEFNEGYILSTRDWNKACSVNMIIDYRTFSNVGYFDEILGVGAKYGAGEDGDFFIRSLNVGGRFLYTSTLYSFHPAANNKYKELPLKLLIQRFNNYGKGVVFLLIKHKMYKDAILICLRGFGGFIISIFKGQFRMSFVYLYSFVTRISLFVSVFLKKMKYNHG